VVIARDDDVAQSVRCFAQDDACRGTESDQRDARLVQCVA
jgi:hypothetical protein